MIINEYTDDEIEGFALQRYKKNLRKHTKNEESEMEKE
jgi:hypothetical protein